MSTDQPIDADVIPIPDRIPSIRDVFRKTVPSLSHDGIIKNQVNQNLKEHNRQLKTLMLIEDDAYFGNLASAYHSLTGDRKKKARMILVDKAEKFKQMIIGDK